jgi:NADH:ubiquinone oxidoreductase subunit E
VGDVYGVATFYSFLSVRPMGRNVIRVCRSLPCHIKSAETVVDVLTRSLGITPGETTGDGRFSLELVNCIGACDHAPAMLVNGNLHGDLTPDGIAAILEEYK